jgi:hypothetical protein
MEGRMPNPTVIAFAGKTGRYYSCSYLKDLQKKDEPAFRALRKDGEVWHTVYHRESDFSEPVIIRKGCGLVNRMGFLLADPEFISGDVLELTGKKHRKLRDDLREAEIKS